MYQQSVYFSQSLSVYGSVLWNAIPIIRNVNNRPIDCFKRSLKVYLLLNTDDV